MEDSNYFLWLVKTVKGDFFIHVSGKWTEAEAAQKVFRIFKLMNIEIIGMLPRKRASGPDEMSGTIVQQLEPKNELGFDFMAGKKLWEVCGRLAEYDAELVLLEKEMADMKEAERR